MSETTLIDGVYLLKEKLGQGGMAAVYLAEVDLNRFDYTTLYAYTQVTGETHHQRRQKAEALAEKLRGQKLDLATLRAVLEAQDIPIPGQRVAVKVAIGEVDLPRFEAEWKDLMCLNHENVVKVYGGGIYLKRPYYAMELLEGLVPPRRVMEEFTIRQKIECMIQAGRGLGYLHANGIVHRDVKPDNLMTCEALPGQFVTKVADLGIAKNLDATVELTMTQTVMGTPRYMAPEQIESSRNVDTRADIYSLGAALYQLVAGMAPYHNKTTAFEIIAAVSRGERPINIKKHRPHLPDALASTIACAMEHERDDRYPTMGDLVADLERYLEDESADVTLSRSFAASEMQKSKARPGQGKYRFEALKRPAPQARSAARRPKPAAGRRPPQIVAEMEPATVIGTPGFADPKDAAVPASSAAPVAAALPAADHPPVGGRGPLRWIAIGTAALIVLTAAVVVVVSRGKTKSPAPVPPQPDATASAIPPVVPPVAQDVDARAVQTVKAILSEGLKRNATGIELQPSLSAVTLRYVGPAGTSEAKEPAVQDYAAVVRRIKTMAAIPLEPGRKPVSGKFNIQASGKVVDVAVTITPGSGSESVSMKLAVQSSPAGLAATQAPDPRWAEGCVLAVGFDGQDLQPAGGGDGAAVKNRCGADGQAHGGATATNGVAGSAIALNGKDGYVSFDHAGGLLGADAVTMAVWVKLTKAATDRPIGLCAPDENALLCVIAPGEMVASNTWTWEGVGLDTSSKGGVAFSASSLAPAGRTLNAYTRRRPPLNAWVHAVGTVSRNEIAVYWDGALVEKKAVNGTFTTPDLPLCLGRYNCTIYDSFLPGCLDEVAVWRRALTAQEVAALYAYSKAGKSYCEAIGASAKPASAKPASETKPPPAVPTTGAELHATPAAPDPRWAEGCVLAYSFGKDTIQDKDGKPQVRDLSGAGNDGRVDGGKFVQGPAGECLALDGKEGGVTVPDSNSLDMTGALTLTAWIWPDFAEKPTEWSIFIKWNEAEGKRAYWLGLGDIGLKLDRRIALAISSANAKFTGGQYARDASQENRVWHHVVAVFEPGRLSAIYIDGERSKGAFQRGNQASGIAVNDLPLLIGREYSPGIGFAGMLDEVALWNRALSAEEVAALYAYSKAGKSYCQAIGEAAKPVTATSASSSPPEQPAAKPPPSYLCTAWPFGRPLAALGVRPEVVSQVSAWPKTNGLFVTASTPTTLPDGKRLDDSDQIRFLMLWSRLKDSFPASSTILVLEPSAGALRDMRKVAKVEPFPAVDGGDATALATALRTSRVAAIMCEYTPAAETLRRCVALAGEWPVLFSVDAERVTDVPSRLVGFGVTPELSARHLTGMLCARTLKGAGGKGTAVVSEALTPTPEVRNLIRTGGSSLALREAMIRAGMSTIELDAASKIAAGAADAADARLQLGSGVIGSGGRGVGSGVTSQ